MARNHFSEGEILPRTKAKVPSTNELIRSLEEPFRRKAKVKKRKGAADLDSAADLVDRLDEKIQAALDRFADMPSSDENDEAIGTLDDVLSRLPQMSAALRDPDQADSLASIEALEDDLDGMSNDIMDSLDESDAMSTPWYSSLLDSISAVAAKLEDITSYMSDEAFDSASLGVGTAARRKAKKPRTKAAGEGELAALEADWSAFASTMDDLANQAYDLAADLESDEISDLLDDVGLAGAPSAKDAINIPMDEVKSGVKDALQAAKKTDGAEEIVALLEEILQEIEAFDYDSWVEQYGEELESRYN